MFILFNGSKRHPRQRKRVATQIEKKPIILYANTIYFEVVNKSFQTMKELRSEIPKKQSAIDSVSKNG
jgi:hypothetical protein